ncbi:MAG: cysteine--tRNA ligase [Lentisphaeria bacterium]|nr:cysteine--tRNA ligase [Lentisphaeria bacterium]
MSLRFFNTLSRRSEEFVPLAAGPVRMYTCGPTVYNFAHIGNFRAYMFEDLLRRTLEYAGYEVKQVMNLTDVDDKTIRDSRACGMKLTDFTRQYKDAFFADLKTLSIEPAEVYPAATDHIPEMIALIERLFEKNLAYQSADGCVYFSIDRFPGYGKLAHIDRENQISGVRIRNDEYDKDAVADFALWKARDEADGDVWWDSPWGPGRPGWHIECSAMSMKYLGESFDIHTGGIDNMFPHHEDEIAQSEGATGHEWVRYWLHCAHLMVNGEKMSKSLGNFYTLRDLLARGWSGREIRMVLLGTHYRKKLNFTFDALEQARETLKRIDGTVVRLRQAGAAADAPELAEILRIADEDFLNGISDDLNISGSTAALFELLKAANRLLDANALSAAGAAAIVDMLAKFDRIFGCFDVEHAAERVAADESAPADVTALAEARAAARKARDFAESDRLRDAIREKGYVIEDAPGGAWRLKKA